MKLRYFNIIFLMGLAVCPCHAHSAVALPPVKYNESIDFKGVYAFAFDDIALGHMGIEARQAPGHYAITADVASAGLINMFVKHTSHTTVEATGKNFIYPDIAYETHYQTRKKARYVKIVHKNGSFSQEKVLPPENALKRPPVSVKLKSSATDPLSFILKIRHELYKARQVGKTAFSINVYDGRRLTEVDFTVTGETAIRYKDSRVPVIAVDVRRKLLAGFTDSELADHDPQEPTLHIYFTSDEREIPIRLETSVFLGTLSATLVSECGAGESCLLGNKD